MESIDQEWAENKRGVQIYSLRESVRAAETRIDKNESLSHMQYFVIEASGSYVV